MTTGTTDVAEAQAAVDASLKAPTVGARRWAGRGPAERRRLLLATHRAVGDAAADWVRAACAIKGIDERLAGEEWSTGPYAVLTALDANADTLQALGDGRSPVDGFDIVDAAGGRRAVRVLPHTGTDRLLLSGFSVDAWFPPGVGDEQKRASAGPAQRDPTRIGEVGAVLGDFDVTAIPPLDALYELIGHCRAALVQLNPITGPLLAALRRAFAPLIESTSCASTPTAGSVRTWSDTAASTTFTSPAAGRPTTPSSTARPSEKSGVTRQSGRRSPSSWVVCRQPSWRRAAGASVVGRRGSPGTPPTPTGGASRGSWPPPSAAE